MSFESRAGIPLEVVLGEHYDNTSKSIPLLREKILDLLETNSQGAVIVFMEESDIVEEVSSEIYNETSKGELLTLAYMQATLRIMGNFETGIKSGILTNAQKQEEWKRFPSASEFSFKKEAFEMLDTFIAKHPKRVRILIESTPKQVYDWHTSQIKKVIQHHRTSKNLIAMGSFSSGASHMKQSLRTMAKNNISREDRILKHLSEIGLQNEIIGIAVFFGAGHTRLVHELKSFEGRVFSRVHPNFADAKDKGRIEYGPYDIALRRLNLTPKKNFPELDWYRVAIGETITAQISDKIFEIPYDEIMKYALRFITKFTSMEEIKEFEKDVKNLYKRHRNSAILLAVVDNFPEDKITSKVQNYL